MKNSGFKASTRVLIFGGFILALVAVATMGYTAYSSVNDLANSLEAAAEPDKYLVALKDLSDDIQKAESSVRTYTLTSDEHDLADYISVFTNIDNRLNDLEVVARNSDVEEARLENVAGLIEERFVILNAIVTKVDSGNEESVFEKLATSIEDQFQASQKEIARREAEAKRLQELQEQEGQIDLQEMAESLNSQKVEEIKVIPKEEPKKKRNIFRKIFGKKDKKEDIDNSETEIAETPSPNTSEEKTRQESKPENNPSPPPREKPVPKPADNKFLEKLKADVKQLKVEQEKEQESQQELQERIIKLITEDTEIADQLTEKIRQMESEQQQKNKIRADAADKESKDTSKFIGVFSVLVLLLCMTLLVIIFNDISRNQKLQARLRKEKARAEKLGKAKEEFLANMSHEIRTPMNAVIGFSEQLAGTKLSRKQEGFLQPIRNSASYLLGLINDILDYSKIESGNFKLEKTGFQPRDVLSEVQSTFSASAETKGVQMVTDLAAEVPEIVIGDPLRLKQMMFNLVSNAIKFTEKGQITAACKLASKKDQTALLAFSVKDTGIGIPEDRLKLIFEDFVQADSSTTRKYGGTGLGLSITKKLTELHAGHVDVNSEVGEGTEITLYIPYDVGTRDDLEIIVSSNEESYDKLIGMNVLVADDEPYNRLLVRTIMDKWGVNIVDVENGRHVIDLIKSGEHFDFVLMDLQMPEMDGFEAAKIIRDELKLDIPVLALTATATQQEIEKSLEIGMNAHLLKPFKERELYALILKVMGINNDGELNELAKVEEERITREIAELAAAMDPELKDEPLNNSSEEIDDNMPAYNFDELYRLANKDKGFMVNMLNIFVSSTNKNLAAMMEGLEKEDWDEVSMRAHKIIPPSRHLGLERIVEQLKEIELDTLNKENLDSMPESVKKVAKEIEETIASIKTDIENMS